MVAWEPRLRRFILPLDPSHGAYELGEELFDGLLVGGLRDALVTHVLVKHDLTVQVLTLGHLVPLTALILHASCVQLTRGICCTSSSQACSHRANTGRGGLLNEFLSSMARLRRRAYRRLAPLSDWPFPPGAKDPDMYR